MTAYTTLQRTLLGASCAGLMACTEFLAVDNPNVIDADNVDPVADATTLRNSVRLRPDHDERPRTKSRQETPLVM